MSGNNKDKYNPPKILDSRIVKTPSGHEIYRVIVQSDTSIPNIKEKTNKKFLNNIFRKWL